MNEKSSARGFQPFRNKNSENSSKKSSAEAKTCAEDEMRSKQDRVKTDYHL